MADNTLQFGSQGTTIRRGNYVSITLIVIMILATIASIWWLSSINDTNYAPPASPTNIPIYTRGSNKFQTVHKRQENTGKIVKMEEPAERPESKPVEIVPSTEEYDVNHDATLAPDAILN
ncbi:MAG: hypothetical protein K6G50_13715 [bacterium]|nr:hypothetical protein [bacterium]